MTVCSIHIIQSAIAPSNSQLWQIITASFSSTTFWWSNDAQVCRELRVTSTFGCFVILQTVLVSNEVSWALDALTTPLCATAVSPQRDLIWCLAPSAGTLTPALAPDWSLARETIMSFADAAASKGRRVTRVNFIFMKLLNRNNNFFSCM